MNELLTQFHLLRPFWLLALIPCLVLFMLLRMNHKEQGNWQRVIAPELLKYLLKGETQRISRFPLTLLGTGWFIACLALSGPTWQKIPTPVSKNQTPLVVVANLSDNMYATDLTPNRLTRMRYKLLDLFSERTDGLSALVVYAGSAHTVAPLTDDYRTLTNLVPALSPEIMPKAGEQTVKGVERAIELIQQGAISHSGLILLITDSVPEGQVSAIESLVKASGSRLSVLGIGTANGAPVTLPAGGFLKNSEGNVLVPRKNSQQLRVLAQGSGGIYRDMSLDSSDLQALLPKPSERDKTITVERIFDQWHDVGYWLVLLLLPLALAAFRKGLLIGLLVFAFIPSPQAEAFDWQSLWETPDQRGMEALNNKEPEAAEALFERPDWKAEALYRSEKYEEAAKIFSQSSSADAFYNQGNALAHAGKLDDALKAYQQALAISPKMKDAIFNKKLVEELKRQQDQTNNSQQNKQNQNSDSQQNQKDQNNNSEQSQNSNSQQDRQNQSRDSQQDQQNQGGRSQQDQQNQNSNPQQAQKNQSHDSQTDQEKAGTNLQKSPRESSDSASPMTPSTKESQNETDQIKTPDQQAIDNWLNTIPDDPGGLLRRKFLYQQQQRAQQRQ